jgi:chromosome partitioning protein
MRFLDSLGIPIIGILGDSQSYVQAAEHGIGITEMPPYRIRHEIDELDRIASWLDGWHERRAMPAAEPRPFTPSLTLVPNTGAGTL